VPKASRAKDTWQSIEREKAAAGGDTTQASIALQIVLNPEGVDVPGDLTWAGLVLVAAKRLNADRIMESDGRRRSG
jgi:hypothetical protein